jgi:hypothetical protein
LEELDLHPVAGFSFGQPEFFGKRAVLLDRGDVPMLHAAEFPRHPIVADAPPAPEAH